jgi:2,3,4,5-tetrahydropyridine-2,6-dicarboxylate N-succinyltransferase
MQDLEEQITDLWQLRDELSPRDTDARDTVLEAVSLLDTGTCRVAEIDEATDEVIVHEWLKLAILLLFRLSDMTTCELGPFEYHDKIPLKTGYAEAGVRVVPGASARFGAFFEPGVILMPSYVNIGARVGSGTMVDTWATVASCAQVGRNVHLSGGVGLGGVLEPPNAKPVVIEDDCMIGSRCMITQGARVGRGTVLGEATVLNPGIPVIDSETGQQLGKGHVPPDCVVVRADRKRQFPGGEFHLPCALIIRRLQPGDRDHLNDILRESEVVVA